MTRVNTNVNSLTAQTRLQRTQGDLQTALTRLSTGLKINSGKDDPAGLIASESLRSDITSIGKALTNTQRANQIIGTADSALGQVSSLLNDVRGLVTEAANKGALSNDEIAANQLQIDSSLEAINRIAQTTTFQGRRLLDGSLDFQVQQGTGFATSRNLQIDSANLGTSGSLAVSVNITSAAAKALVSNAGIAPAGTSVAAAGSLTFSDSIAANEASSTISLGQAYTPNASATGTIALANSYTPANEAAGTLTLGSGAALTITAVDGSSIDGAAGNGVILNVTTNNTATTGSFNATTNTLTLSLLEGANGAAAQTALTAIGAITSRFTFSAGNATNVAAGDAGVRTGVLTGGTNTVASAGFDLTAVDGGAADGLIGNSAKLFLTSGATTAATYDAGSNRLNVTVAAGASIASIASAINTQGTFLASNTSNGTYKFDTANSGVNAATLAGGTNTPAAGAFVLTAANGGLADGLVGNNTTVKFATGNSTTAAFNATSKELLVTVAANATVQNIADAITASEGSNFVVSGIVNGTSKFNRATGSTDLGTNSAAFTGGTNSATAAVDTITVTADTAGATPNGVSVSLIEDASVGSGIATASLNNGNIEVRVRNSGNTAINAIVTAINGLSGYGATLAASSNGDGLYRATTEAPPAVGVLAGGVTGGGLSADLAFQLTGTDGSEVFKFKAGATISNIIQSVNLLSDSTGVEASNNAGALELRSTKYGSASTVSVEVISEGVGGTFTGGLSATRANGADVQATVNGSTALGKGNTLSLNTSTLSFSLTVNDGSSTAVNFTINGGGAQFQLGPDVVSNQQARLGIGSLNTAKLGGVSGKLFELASGGAQSLTKDITGGSKIISEVISRVTTLRGRLGAFQRTALESNTNSLNDTLANLNEAQSLIRDADFAKESANLTRAQILVQSGTSVLGIANQSAQSVLSLLR